MRENGFCNYLQVTWLVKYTPSLMGRGKKSIKVLWEKDDLALVDGTDKADFRHLHGRKISI